MDTTENASNNFIKYVIFYIFIGAAFISLGPAVFNSNWISTSDLYSTLELSSALIALTAGLSCIIYFWGLGNRFFLLIGLGFLIAGIEDMVHGIISFQQFTTDLTINFNTFYPITYSSGRTSLAMLCIIAPFLEKIIGKKQQIFQETRLFLLLGLLISGVITILALILDMPQIIFPENFISRPIDFFSALLFLAAIIINFNRFKKQVDTFTGFLLASLIFNMGGQFYMSFSKSLFDAGFDLAHAANIFSYVMPVIGLSMYALKQIKTARSVEDQLRLQGLRLSLAIQSAKIGIWELDMRRNRLIWDDRMYELYGRDELPRPEANECWHKGVHPEDLPLVKKEIQNTLEKEKVFDMKYRIVRPSGEVLFIAANALVMRDDYNIPYRAIGINYDLTYRKLIEDELTKQGKQLTQVNKKLEEYTYTVSHDLKEPIRSIRSFSEFIKEEYEHVLDETGQDYLSRIIRASNRMSLMINDLLVLSKVGKQDIKFKETDLNTLLQHVKDQMNDSITKSNAKITGPELPRIICQPAWISVLLQNLISNAIKYKQDAAPEIKIDYTELPDYYEFSVEDNGIGIEKEFHEKVFALFRKSHKNSKIEGSGAGLAIVNSITEEHEGKVWIDWSELDKGTRVKFTISKNLRVPNPKGDTNG